MSAAAHERLVDAFMRAVQMRDRDALVALFAREATLTSDGGGKAKAARKVVRGGESVARFFAGVLRRADSDLSLRKILVNGESGIAIFVGERLVGVMSLLTGARHILGVYSVLNPDKLRNVMVAKPH